MINVKKSKVKKSKDNKKKINKTNVNKPSFETDVIEKDLCTLLPKEWLKSAAKTSGMIIRERKIETVMNVYSSQAVDPHVNRERFRAEWWS